MGGEGSLTQSRIARVLFVVYEREPEGTRVAALPGYGLGGTFPHLYPEI